MNMRQITHARVATLCALALAAACTAGYAQETGPSGADAPAAEKPGPSRYESVAIQHVNEAVSVTRELELEPRLKPLLQQAKGLFIIPSYGRAAFGIGGRGGAGVLLVKQADGNWSSPAFYNIGGLNIGLQAGIQGGPMAFILTNEKAINRFRQRNNFSLNAAAGITVLQWTKVAEGSTGSGDAVAWSGAKGIFGDVASIGINDVHFNLRLNQAYYHASQSVAIADILSGKTSNMHADELKQQAAAITGSMSSMGR
jgi:SH3 domain-containing YSC84-like protein 1